MIDFQLPVTAIEELLRSLPAESKVERYKSYASIIHLVDEVDAILNDRGVEDAYIKEKISELRFHTAQAAGLIDYGHTMDQYLSWCYGALNSMRSALEQLDCDLSFQ